MTNLPKTSLYFVNNNIRRKHFLQLCWLLDRLIMLLKQILYTRTHKLLVERHTTKWHENTLFEGGRFLFMWTLNETAATTTPESGPHIVELIAYFTLIREKHMNTFYFKRHDTY